MPLNNWLSVANKGTSVLRFTADGGMISGQYFDLVTFSMNSNYKLIASNLAQAVTVMCQGSSNCFVNSNGFSAADHDMDADGSFCAPNYSSVGWWYSACYSYNAHRTDSPGHYRHTQFATSTETWSWFMR